MMSQMTRWGLLSLAIGAACAGPSACGGDDSNISTSTSSSTSGTGGAAGGGGGGGAACGNLSDCNGTCVDTSLDPNNCGACGTVCGQGEVCNQGQCASGCSGGTTDCSGSCVNTNFDPDNCGSCANACAQGEVCSGGQCALQCSGGTTDCSGLCVDTNLDPQNCGSCANACAQGEVCSGGQCALQCSGGTTDCSGICVDTDVDAANCGACSNACAQGEICSGGQCALSCAPPTVDCGGTCTNTQFDPQNCGACNTACGPTEACYQGSCAPLNPQTIVRDAVQRGWWNSVGSHTSTNNNTLTGMTAVNTYNSYFIFDLSGITGTVLAADLVLEIEAYSSGDPSESLSVWDVSTPAATLEATGNDVNIFNDLMSGNQYGSFTVLSSEVGVLKNIPLGGQLVNDINAALGGPFSVGVHSDTATANQWVRFSWQSEARTHQLVLTVL